MASTGSLGLRLLPARLDPHVDVLHVQARGAAEGADEIDAWVVATPASTFGMPSAEQLLEVARAMAVWCCGRRGKFDPAGLTGGARTGGLQRQSGQGAEAVGGPSGRA